MRWRRRLLVVILAAAAVAAVRARRRIPVAASPPEWPPLRPTAPANPPATPPKPARAWVEPVDGACPDGYPVKANASSGIFHVPGGRFYDRTKPERCYATSADAERDGYRAAKA